MREALKLIADIASGSTTANSLQNIAKIAQEALAQLEQEPVAWMLNGFPYKEKQVQVGGSCRGQEFPNQTPLYTTPPQRTWVGLSQENFIYFCSYVRSDVLSEIEAKLKELNT